MMLNIKRNIYLMKFNAALGEKWVIHSPNIGMPLRWSYELLIHLKAKSIALLLELFFIVSFESKRHAAPPEL
jgi:hypothetical protein